MPASTPVPAFSNAAGQLLEDPAGFVQAHWSAGPRRLADTQALFNAMARSLLRHRWSRILINQVAMPPFSHDEQQWIADQWLPYAVETAGYRYGGVVVSPSVFTRLATAYITTHVQGLPLIYRSFETDAEARAWLLRQPAAPGGDLSPR